MKIVKRDGRKVDFDKFKIVDAVLAAFESIDGKITDYAEVKAGNIADYISDQAEKADHELTIEEIQDICERGLMSTKRKDVAKAFIQYRDERTKARGSITDSTFMEYLAGKSEYWNNENSNKDANVVTTQRDYIAGIASTDLARRFLLPKDVCEAHDAGILHQHDMDYMAQRALTNCCLVNLEDMLQNGTMMNGVKIDPQKRISTAATVATQIITAVASSQYGGTTITLAHLAPFVRKSFTKHFKDGIKYCYDSHPYWEDMEHIPDEINFGDDKDECHDLGNIKAYNYAFDMTKKEIKDAVQTFNYQINSMSTTNGQAPFLSVVMWAGEDPEYEYENALLIEEFLKQRIVGMKNKQGVYVTPAFPKLLYVLDEDNITEDSRYWYLTELAAKCTAKRMVPDYISAKIMRENKINHLGQGDVYGCMGCRSFLTADRCTKNYAKALNYNPNKGKYYGRFNLGVTTLNLADLAFSSKGDLETFWKLFEERTELCHKGLRARINRLEEVTSDIAPILWQDGAFARLEKGEKITDLIYHGYSTASLGYAGLYECVKFMTSHSHTDHGIGEQFGLEVMNALNNKCSEWKEKEDIDYSLYGSPIESTTYKFAKALKNKFGKDVFIKLDGHDRDYITNSYHVPVFEEISPFDKLEIESKFQKLSPGGAISYIETADLTNNIKAVLSTLKFIYNHIMYAELNTKSDYCQKCGYEGEIKIDKNNEWYCPNCGNRDHDTMNVARRTCGYIGAHFWNYGRTNEIKDRYVHLGGEQ